jgi:predicted HAD superfamily Cof-like phosphohydrolase
MSSHEHNFYLGFGDPSGFPFNSKGYCTDAHLRSVLEFNIAFETEMISEFDEMDFSEYSTLLDNKLALVYEEINELINDGLRAGNDVETVDALIDILYVCYGLLVGFNIIRYSPTESEYVKYTEYIYYRCTTDPDARAKWEKTLISGGFKNSIGGDRFSIAKDCIIHRFTDHRLRLERNRKIESITNIIQAIDNIIYDAYIILEMHKINIDKAFYIVHNSNMSKLCDNEEDAIETTKRYKNETPKRYDSPNYRLSKDGEHYIVYNETTKKILKNYKYKPADLLVSME